MNQVLVIKWSAEASLWSLESGRLQQEAHNCGPSSQQSPMMLRTSSSGAWRNRDLNWFGETQRPPAHWWGFGQEICYHPAKRRNSWQKKKHFRCSRAMGPLERNKGKSMWLMWSECVRACVRGRWPHTRLDPKGGLQFFLSDCVWSWPWFMTQKWNS